MRVPGNHRIASSLAALLCVPIAMAQTRPAPAHEGRAPADMRVIEGGTYRPFYRTSEGTTTVPIRTFLLDTHPVTNGDYLAFVRANPRWRRSQIPAVFADRAYLSRWAGDEDPGARAGERQPVVEVSWFAASAYCRWRGRRLPTEYEWEYAARAGFDRAEGARDPEFTQRILAWYSHPQPETLPEVMSNRPNYWGVYDLHGLVWEWVQDFNPPTVSSDSRQSGDSESSRFCGGAALTSADQADYAAFIRHAMRYSLRGTYAVSNLGFRCAANQENGS